MWKAVPRLPAWVYAMLESIDMAVIVVRNDSGVVAANSRGDALCARFVALPVHIGAGLGKMKPVEMSGGISWFAGAAALDKDLPPFRFLAVVGEEDSVLFVDDGLDPAKVSPEAIRAMFGLCRGESEVAAALASGHRLGQIAQTADVSLHTIEKTLRRVFAKIGTHTQAGVVRAILTSPARMINGGRNGGR